MRHFLRLSAVLLLALVTGCGGCGRSGIALPAHQHLQAVVLVPDHATMFVGERLSFRAVAAFDDGPPRDLAPDEVTWASANEENVGFEHGTAFARAPGETTITAESAGNSAQATVTVSASAVASFAIVPSRALVAVGETLALQATATLEDGTTLDLTSASTGTAWTSGNPTRVEVSTDGVVKGLAEGLPVEVSAQNGNLSATALVRVTSSSVQVVSLEVRPSRLVLEAGSVGAVHAIALLSDGSELDVSDAPGISWSSAAPDAVLVDPHGNLSALQPATHVAVSASLGGRRAAALVDVTQARLVALSLQPNSLELAIGSEASLVLTGRYADGHLQPLTADPRVEWRSEDGRLVQVEAGRVGALAAGGPVLVHALLGALDASATVTVRPARLTGLTLAPAEGEVLLGGTLGLTVVGQFDDGSTRDLTDAASGTRFDVEPAGFLGVDPHGVARGERLGGPVAVLAKNGGFEARASLRVTARPDQLVSIGFSPSEIRLGLAQSADLQLVGTYGDGHTADLTGAASGTVYSSADRALVDVDAGGRVSAYALGGPVAITGANGGLVATALVTVAAPPPTVTALSVDPRAITGKIGDSVHLQVTATLSDGSARDVTAGSAGTTYAISGDPNVAKVSADGVVTLTSPGSAALVITNGLQHTFATIQADSRTLIDLRIAPGRLDLPVGLVDRVTVTGVFTDGTTVDLTAASTGTVYASAKPAVATVDAEGHVHALTVGSSTLSVANRGLIRRVGIRVREAQISGVALSPPTASVVAGRTLQLVCTAMLDTGRLVDVSASLSGTTWVSANPQVATVSPEGLLRGVAAGHTQVSCINHGKVGASDITVTPPVADEVVVSPAAAKLPKGRVLPLSVTVRLSDGTVRDASGASSGTLYFAADPTIAPVSADGVVTALSEGGPVSVTALVAGSTNEVQVTVVPPAVDALACRPASISLKTGESAPVAIDATWSDGSVTTLSPADGIVFRSADPSVAAISATGVVTAAAAGRTQVYAYLGGVVARCPVEVLP